MLHPGINTACGDVISTYRSCLRDGSTFAAWTLENAVDALRRVQTAHWVDDFHDRYLNIAKIDATLGGFL